MCVYVCVRSCPELQWSDRTAVSLDGPWAAGQPDTNNGTQNCVELHVTSGTLALRDCSLPRNWLCALPQGNQHSFSARGEIEMEKKLS